MHVMIITYLIWHVRKKKLYILHLINMLINKLHIYIYIYIDYNITFKISEENGYVAKKPK